MKMWYRHEGRSKASKLALEILEYVDEHLRGFEWRPRITSIGIRADCGDIYDFEVELEFSPGAFVVVRYGDCDDTERGGICTDSDAIGRVLTGLGGMWRLAGVIAWVPRAVRDPLYRWIARNRYRLFGTTACHVPTDEQRARFL